MTEHTEDLEAGRAPRDIPVVRGGLQLAFRPWDFLASLPAHGDLVQVRVGPWRAYVLCAPELTRQVLRDGRTFDKGGPLFDQARFLMGNGLGTCPHDEHQKQRRSLQPAFTDQRLPAYAAVMSEQAEVMTESWRDGDTIDVIEAMLKCSSGIIAKTLFSVELTDDTLQALVEDARTVVRGIFKRAFIPPLVARMPLPTIKRFDRAISHLRAAFQSIIRQYRDAGVDCGDLLSILLAYRDDRGKGLTDDEICDQLGTMFFAGIETVATTLSWSLHALDRDRTLLSRVHAEVDSSLAGRAATWDDLPRLDLLRRVVTETLRLYTPGWFLSRVVTSATTLAGHHIPQGTLVFYSPLIIHQRASEYPDPERFNPDRWPSDRDGRIPNSSSYIPFGGGARTCIGNEFAMIEATLILASIVRRWEMRAVSDRPVRPALAIAMVPRRLRLQAVRRAPLTTVDSTRSGDGAAQAT